MQTVTNKLRIESKHCNHLSNVAGEHLFNVHFLFDTSFHWGHEHLLSIKDLKTLRSAADKMIKKYEKQDTSEPKNLLSMIELRQALRVYGNTSHLQDLKRYKGTYHFIFDTHLHTKIVDTGCSKLSDWTLQQWIDAYQHEEKHVYDMTENVTIKDPRWTRKTHPT